MGLKVQYYGSRRIITQTPKYSRNQGSIWDLLRKWYLLYGRYIEILTCIEIFLHSEVLKSLRNQDAKLMKILEILGNLQMRVKPKRWNLLLFFSKSGFCSLKIQTTKIG